LCNCVLLPSRILLEKAAYALQKHQSVNSNSTKPPQTERTTGGAGFRKASYPEEKYRNCGGETTKAFSLPRLKIWKYGPEMLNSLSLLLEESGKETIQRDTTNQMKSSFTNFIPN